jgi:hypothetical protein
MSAPTHYRVTVKWGAVAVAAITLLSMMPQVWFWLARGSQWQGAYTVLQPDEVVYSAYVNALIDERPRRTDPASGQDDHPQARLPESLFSIQFIPPLIIAWLSRISDASASSAFIALMGVVGLLTSLSLFWLLVSMMGDSRLAAVSVLIVLCLGALAAGQGIVGLFLKADVKFLGMPFLRRYVPAFPFPLFFIFCGLIWRALTSGRMRGAILKALLAGVILAILVFSYFYLWTAALAWLVCVCCLWLVIRRDGKGQAVRVLAIAAAPLVIAVAAFLHLLSQLPPASSKVQVLSQTHSPDLLHVPELIGVVILIIIFRAVRRRQITLSEPKVIFSLSFSLLPILVFNQQIVTGHSIQPFHYEVLIANYVVLVGLVTIIGYLRPTISRRMLILIGTLCVLWALVEISLPFQAHYDLHAATDDMVPVLLRLKEKAAVDGTWQGLREQGKTSTLVFSPQYGISELLPVWAPQGSLLAPGSASFQGLSDADRKECFYMHFYYTRRSTEYLRDLLNNRTDLFYAERARSMIFGAQRVSTVLTSDFEPIRQEEIEQEINSYEAFAKSFSREQAAKRQLGYAVVLSSREFDFSNIDLWYEREGGEQVGAYILYPLKLRR